MKRVSFLSVESTPWALSLGIHVFFVAAVLGVTRSRMIDLPLVTLDLAPLASSASSAPEDLDQWRKPLSKHHMVLAPKPQPTPNPQPSLRSEGPVRSVAQVGTLPHFKTKIEPVYPPEAKRANVEGVVIIQVEIDASGKVMDAQVAQSLGSGCDEAALAAIKGSQFVPAYEDGKPVPVRVRIPYRFSFN